MIDTMQIGGVQPARPIAPQPSETTGRVRTGDFQDILKSTLDRPESVKFSMHAQTRMQHRNIRMSASDVERLERGVDQLAQKGGRESLVFMDQSAFLVSVQNRTVITAIGQDNLKESVFTNIDSAIVL